MTAFVLAPPQSAEAIRFTAPKEPRSPLARRTAAAASERIAAKKGEIARRVPLSVGTGFTAIEVQS